MVREVLSTSGVGTIRLRLYSGLGFCDSVVHTRAQIRGGFMLSSLEASHLDFWNQSLQLQTDDVTWPADGSESIRGIIVFCHSYPLPPSAPLGRLARERPLLAKGEELKRRAEFIIGPN